MIFWYVKVRFGNIFFLHTIYIYISLRNINAKYQLTGIAYDLTPNLCLNEDNGNRVGIVGN